MFCIKLKQNIFQSYITSSYLVIYTNVQSAIQQQQSSPSNILCSAFACWSLMLL